MVFFSSYWLSHLENFTLLKKFESLVVDLIHPPCVAWVELSFAFEKSSEPLFDLVFGFSTALPLFSFCVPIFWFLLLEMDENEIVGKDGKARVDLRSTLLLLEIRLGRFTMWACFELTPGTAGNFLIGLRVTWLRPRPPNIPEFCGSFSVSRYCTFTDGEELLDDPSSRLLFSFSFVLNVLPLWMPLSSVIVPWLDEEQEL